MFYVQMVTQHVWQLETLRWISTFTNSPEKTEENRTEG